MPKEDIVGKVIGAVTKPVAALRKEVYSRVPNGYTKSERESMEDDQAKRLPNYYGKQSKFRNQYEDLIRQESRTPGPLGTQSRRDEMIDDMGGQVEIQTRSKNRSFKRTPDYAKSKVASAKYAADRNSGGARPIQGPVQITAKQAAQAMSGKSASKSNTASAKPAPSMRSLMGMPKPKK
jgi:hypothetical protein